MQDAARLLGISEGAVRKRVTRNTLRHDKEEDGRVYVYLDERDTRGVDAGVYGGVGAGVDAHNDALISSLEDQIAYLREENRRKDEIIMQQAVTMRQLTAAPEPRDEPETGAEASEGGADRSDTAGAQEGAQEHSGMPERPPEETARRPWWLRWFGG